MFYLFIAENDNESGKQNTGFVEDEGSAFGIGINNVTGEEESGPSEDTAGNTVPCNPQPVTGHSSASPLIKAATRVLAKIHRGFFID